MPGSTAGLAKILSPLISSAKKLLPEAKLVYAERKAARDPFAQLDEIDPLDKLLKDALGRLGAVSDHSPWWKQIVFTLEQQFVRPDFFEIISVREWLSEQDVQRKLIAFARLQLLGREPDSTLLDSLSEAYSKATGEHKRYAELPIQIVLAVLVASVLASLSVGEGVLLGVTRDQNMQMNEMAQQVANIAARVSRSDPLHDKEALQELERIRRSRWLPGLDTKEEIRRLVNRIEMGDLSLVNNTTSGMVYAWAARIYANDVSGIEQASAYLAAAKERDGQNQIDIGIAETWILFSSGEIAKALRQLRSMDSSDARSSILSILSRKEGAGVALKWFEDSYRGLSDHLSPIGWRNLAVMLAENDEWDEAVAFLSQLPVSYFEDCPDLLYTRAVFHAGYLLPRPVRAQVLGLRQIDPRIPIQEGKEADDNRRESIMLFQRAKELMLQIGASQRAEACEYWLMWLRMTDPNQKHAAIQELKKIMESGGEKSSLYADIAFAFEVPFNENEFERNLRVRGMEGGLNPRDYVNKLNLLKRSGKSKQVLGFLEQEESQLKQVLLESSFAAIRIVALLEDGQYDKAQLTLEEHKTLFSNEDIARISLMISDRRGEDPFAELEALYTRTMAYQDLINVVNYLVSKKRWAALIPYARCLLEQEHKAANLNLLIESMELGNASPEEILALIHKYDDLVTMDTDGGMNALARKAWALFHLGRFNEARTINDQLVQRRNAFNDVGLELNIALLSGQWEHFSAVLDREFPNRERLPSDLLVHLAALASDDVPDRSMELLRVAAKSAPNDGAIQAACYSIAVHLGREMDATPWLHRAVELSKTGEGPLTPVSPRELGDMMPERRRAWLETNRMFMRGDLSVHLAASFMSFTMAGLLVGQARRNEAEKDPRQRSIIPVRHGGRQRVKLQELRRLASDVSTLLVLEDLGLLGPLLESIEVLIISSTLMEVLFREHRQVRFHQPSLVAEARKIQKLIGDGVITTLKPGDPVPSHLLKEVGEEMAMLLNSARSNGGRVIAVVPLRKVGSFGEEIADIGDFSDLILTTTQLVDVLFEDGFIDEAIRDNAKVFLSQVDNGLASCPGEVGDSNVYIDDLALDYLGTAGVLNYLSRLGRRIFVAPSVAERAKALIEADEQGSTVGELIDKLRLMLATGLSGGKVKIVSETASEEEGILEAKANIKVFADLLAVAGNVDAICADDRMLGRFAQVSGKHGASPTVGIIDIIDFLVERGRVSTTQHRNLLLRLRERGYAFIPFNLEDIYSNLIERYDPQSKKIRENAYLRAPSRECSAD